MPNQALRRTIRHSPSDKISLHTSRARMQMSLGTNTVLVTGICHGGTVRSSLSLLVHAACLVAAIGCGTTHLTNTSRSASEEMLLSHAVDGSVGQLDLQVLAGQRVFLDTTNLGEVIFSQYLTGALRQHLLASGARLVADRENADVVVEARAGAIATAQHESIVGIPQTTVPAVIFGSSATLPEIAIFKRVVHIGVAKVGVFAYRVDNGEGVWQSGIRERQSTSESRWYVGMGPFQSGDVVLDGHLPEIAAARQSTRSCSSLEHERWVGELPPPGDPKGIARDQPADAAMDEPDLLPDGGLLPDGDLLPEAIEPDGSKASPEPDAFWQWISPVVVSPK